MIQRYEEGAKRKIDMDTGYWIIPELNF